MSAEEIATVVAGLRARQFRIPQNTRGDLASHVATMRKISVQVIGDSLAGPVVDATAVYRSLVDTPSREIDLYQDHPNIAPPWREATICYQNQHGNVIMMLQGGYEADEVKKREGPSWRHGLSDRWEPAQPVDWDRVRWIIDTILWIGGRGGSGPFPTTGPMHIWRFAVYDDGTPADLHWLQVVDDDVYPMRDWDMAHLVLLGTLNFMQCRNIELVEPRRPRPQQRRITRTGVRISEINVFPIGKSRRGAGRQYSLTGGVPLSSVRGHFAHYGACCSHHEPRGMLFGKLTGRYWIPQHARGTTEHGEVEQHVTLHEENDNVYRGGR